MKRLLFLIFIVFQALSPSLAKSNKPKASIEEQWLFELEHENSGCPINSECSKTMGKLRKKWLMYLKKYDAHPKRESKIEAFRKNYGIPVDFWTTADSSSVFSPILWDSPCPHHKPKGKIPLMQGQAFVKDGKKGKVKIVVDEKKGHEISDTKLLQFDPIVVEENGKLLTFNVPSGDIPLSKRGKYLNILKDYQGHYVNLQIGVEGDWRIRKLPTSPGSDSSQCSDKLVEFAQKNYPKSIYQSYYCREIYELKQKKYVKALIPWTCQ